MRAVFGFTVGFLAPNVTEAVVAGEACSGPAISANFSDTDNTDSSGGNFAPATAATCPGSMVDGSGDAQDLVYRVAAPISGMVTVTADPEAHDLVLYVLSPTCPSGVFTENCIVGADSGGAGTAEQVTFAAVAGHEYFIVVSGWSFNAGRYAITVTGLLSPFDIDGDGEVSPLSDGLLMLRWQFGFSGATLVTGAVDLANCFRCNASAIEGYLTGLKAGL